MCLPGCACAPSCEATTGGLCWFLGAENASCDATCTAASRTYDPATLSYAGSAGTDANCGAVLTDLGSTAAYLGADPFGTCVGGYGGAILSDVLGIRCAGSVTTSSSASAGVRRACACQ